MGQKLEALQALRAIAAGLVVLIHALYTYEEKIGPVSDLWPKYDAATFGVKVFFCISGYIVFMSASSTPAGAASCSLFARRRIIRIVPMYWAATLIYVAKLSLQDNPPTALDIARSLFFVPYLDDSHHMRPVLGAGWTLNFEMAFYAVLCASLLLKPQHRPTIVAGAIAGALALHWSGLVSPGFEPGATNWTLICDPVLLFFFVGVLTARLKVARRKPAMLLGPVGGKPSAALLVLCAFLVPACVFGLDWLGDQHSPARVLAEVLICGMLMLICSASNEHQARGGRLVRLLSVAGDGSYSTYLFHGFVMGPAARVLQPLHPEGISPWSFAAAMVVLCTLVGVLIHKFVEHPLQSWMNARWARPKTTQNTIGW